MTNINKRGTKKVGIENLKKPFQKKKPSGDPLSSGMALPFLRKVYLRPSNVVITVTAIILIGFFLRVGIWEHFYLKRMEGSPRQTPIATENVVLNDNGEAVDEAQPTAQQISEYKVAPNKPRYFTISSISNIRQARIVEIGTLPDGALSTPASIYDVGWYRGSDLPGGDGTVVMDGHSGTGEIGVFGRLPKVRIGDDIVIEMGDGRKFTYRIVDTATKALGAEAEAYMADAFTTPVVGQGSLTLITCTGTYLPKQKTYDHRFFARAVLEK